MSVLTESVAVEASLAEAWDRFLDPAGWSAWVDGFARVLATERYPETGGSLRWASIPAGRGEVTERVLEHEPRRVHRVAFSDPSTEGELTTRFAIEGSGAVITQELSYRLLSGGPLAWLTDRLFIRSQIRGSMRRSLERFALELE
ncbi:MAG: SRPBCC family protein [Solirubrobacterales bacterium]